MHSRTLWPGAVLAAMLLVLPIQASWGAPPSVVNYQGMLSDSTGAPHVGTFDITFSLYGISFGGSPLWTETMAVTTDSEGRFSVHLGETIPLDASNFDVGPRYLGITIDPEPELVPRQQLVSVPYSLRTATIAGAGGGQVFGDLDLSGEILAQGQTSLIRFQYDTFGELPDPTAFHGAIGHVHDSGAVFFAHAGAWVRLANASEVVVLSRLSASDGDPDSAVVVDTAGDVHILGVLRGLGGPLVVGGPGLVVNGPLAVNGGPANVNVPLLINNGLQVIGGNLLVVGPRRLVVQNLAELELEPGARMVTRTSSEVHLDAGTIWTSSAPLRTEAEVEVYDPGYIRVRDTAGSSMMTLELDNLEIGTGLRTMELRAEDLTAMGGRFEISGDTLGLVSPVPIEMVALSLTGAPGLAVTGGGGVSVTGGGALTTGPGSPAVFNGPSQFNVPINAPLQVGVGPGGAGALHVVGNITATGAKLFVQDHPQDPSKVIHYVALEAGEAGTYTRGTATLSRGVAEIVLPEHFSLVTGSAGLTAQITPRGPLQSMLYVESVTPKRIIVKSSHPQDRDVKFDYLVNGVRLGFEDHQVVVDRPELVAR